MACSVAWLTPEEAQAKTRVLLFRSAVPIPEVPARADGRRAYRLRTPLLSAGQTTAYLDKLTGARIEAGTRMLTVRDTGSSTALLCWGYPLVVRDWRTGRLTAHPHLSQSFVAPGHLSRACRDVLLTLLAECLADEFNVPVHALLVPYREVRVTRRGDAPVAVRQGSLLFMQGLARLTPMQPGRGRAAVATRMLRDHLLDPDVARLARQATSSSFPLADYNQVLTHRELYERVNAQTPTLLPTLHGYIQGLPTELRELPGIGAEEFVRKDFDGARQALLQTQGASKQTWKYLLQVPRSAMKAFTYSDRVFRERNQAPNQALTHALARLQPLALLCRLGIPAKSLGNRVALQGLMSLWARWSPIAHPEVPLDYVRRFSALALAQLWQHRADEKAQTAVRREARNTLDWLVQEGFSQGHPRHGAPWAELAQRSEAWHQRDRVTREEARAAALYATWQKDAAAIEAKYAANRSADGLGWDELLPTFSWEGLRAHPLRTSQALWDEHVLMRHCADTYLETCWSGASRLFHLADPKRSKRRSTLELVRGPDGKWQERQHEGPCGHPPHPSLLPLAKELVRQARLAHSR